jgi:signal transduction histidine kinase/CheY-like chemotaxis protein
VSRAANDVLERFASMSVQEIEQAASTELLKQLHDLAPALLQQRHLAVVSEAMQEQAKLGSWMVDFKLKTFEWSDQVLRIFEREFAPSDHDEFIALVHEQDRSRVKEAWKAACARDEVYDIEYRLARTDDERWVRGRLFLERDPSGELVRGIGTVQDVTETKVANDAIRDSENRIREADKARSLSTMAAAIAHTFNNLLGAVLGNLDLVRLDDNISADARGHLASAEEATRHAAEIARKMLMYVGQRDLHRRSVDLGALSQTVAKRLSVRLPKRISLTVSVQEELPEVEIDVEQIEVLIHQIVINAAEALEEGPDQLGRAQEIEIACNLEDSFVVLSVRDNGPGMTPQQIALAFDPFYSTRFPGRGLGLSTVLGVARAHGGSAWVQSELSCGTTVFVRLPVEQGAAEITPESAKTVLLVDDDERLRRVCAQMVRQLGYAVVEAASGHQAIELFKARSIDVVVLDVALGELDGWETLAVLRDSDPNARALMISGYEIELSEPPAGVPQPNGLLSKPFQLRDLKEALEDALDDA